MNYTTLRGLGTEALDRVAEYILGRTADVVLARTVSHTGGHGREQGEVDIIVDEEIGHAVGGDVDFHQLSVQSQDGAGEHLEQWNISRQGLMTDS